MPESAQPTENLYDDILQFCLQDGRQRRQSFAAKIISSPQPWPHSACDARAIKRMRQFNWVTTLSQQFRKFKTQTITVLRMFIPMFSGQCDGGWSFQSLVSSEQRNERYLVTSGVRTELTYLLRSFWNHNFRTKRLLICDFLLVINTNLHPIFHSFQLVADY